MLKVGDIFLATYPALVGGKGQGICLVVSESAGGIEARTVTTQWTLKFDRASLMAVSNTGAPFTVTYAKPLPQNVQSAFLGLDRRYSAGGEARLTNEEKQAILFVANLSQADGGSSGLVGTQTAWTSA